jgi:hypothetical protein
MAMIVIVLTAFWLGWMWQQIRKVDQLLDETREMFAEAWEQRESARLLRRQAEIIYDDALVEQTRPLPLIFNPAQTFGRN